MENAGIENVTSPAAGMVLHRRLVSSNLVSATYDPAASTMDIEFRGGRVYRYQNVPRRLFELLIEARSAGSFFAQFVKPNTHLFPYSVVRQ